MEERADNDRDVAVRVLSCNTRRFSTPQIWARPEPAEYEHVASAMSIRSQLGPPEPQGSQSTEPSMQRGPMDGEATDMSIETIEREVHDLGWELETAMFSSERASYRAIQGSFSTLWRTTPEQALVDLKELKARENKNEN